MIRTALRNLLSSSRARKSTQHSRPKGQLLLEHLEDRTVPSVVPVTPGNLDGWQVRVTGDPLTASVQFVNGPETPPLGSGSVQLAVGTNGDGAAEIRNTDFAGVKLSDLTALSYSTYVSNNIDGQAPYLILQVDYDNNGSVDDLLFFEPLYSGPTFFPEGDPGTNPDTVELNTWQTWNALEGGWYSVFGTNGSGPGTGVVSLDTFFDTSLGGDADATIVNSASGLGGLRVVAGFGAGAWDNFVGNVDAVTVGVAGVDTTYDFEAPSVVYVNDDWDETDPGADPDGEGPATSFGLDAFADIQSAVDAVAEGGTVNVQEGTYTGGIVLSREVTVRFFDTEESGDAVVTSGDFSLAVNNANGTGAFAVLADDVVIEGLTLEGDGTSASNYGIYIAAGSDGTIIRDNDISGFARNGITTEFGGGSSNLLIECNTITDIGSVGIYLQTGDNNVVRNNTVSGGHANLTIDSESGDVITGNTFTGGEIGVEFFESLGAGTLAGTRLNFNNITGHSVAGVQNFGSTLINAENNWWGSASGPSGQGPGTGDAVLGPVDFSPWLGISLTKTTLIFTDGTNTLVVDSATGSYSLTYRDEGVFQTVTGTGARVKNGRFQLHDQGTSQSSGKTKVDARGSTEEGVLTLNIRGKRKLEFRLSAVTNPLEEC